jgi:hypothetical protein
MDVHKDASGDIGVRTLEYELELVRSAVLMVASGGAPRVSLGGLRFGEELVEPARKLALAAGVRIVPRWASGDEGTGISVERISDE